MNRLVFIFFITIVACFSCKNDCCSTVENTSESKPLNVVVKQENNDDEDNVLNYPTKEGKCYFFFITDCPASRNSLPQVQKVHDKYSEYGIEVIGVVSDPEIDRKKLKETIAEFNITFDIIEDEDLEIAKKHGATITPEVFLYDNDSKEIYSGMVDNYYIALGKHRNKASIKYLNSAVSRYLLGKDIIKTKTEAVGCIINFNY